MQLPFSRLATSQTFLKLVFATWTIAEGIEVGTKSIILEKAHIIKMRINNFSWKFVFKKKKKIAYIRLSP